MNTRQSRAAQAALKLCGSLEQYRELGTGPVPAGKNIWSDKHAIIEFRIGGGERVKGNPPS